MMSKYIFITAIFLLVFVVEYGNCVTCLSCKTAQRYCSEPTVSTTCSGQMCYAYLDTSTFESNRGCTGDSGLCQKTKNTKSCSVCSSDKCNNKKV
ncbi:hypothetical protein HHI36_000687 [Cryptolaemus montrouzieri]|uniref:Uncharacterized protein n=1 Tax=Cryptolaemus montrouzieri TaxID=559131 RepID=A0ABD2P6R5_9CUCU